MRPSEIGAVAHECWNEIPQHIHTATLDASVVMPNHLHGIVVIGTGTPSGRTGTPWRALTRWAAAFGNPVPGSLAPIVGLFKQAVTTRARNLVRVRDDIVRARHGVPRQVWQRNYYEHVIRNENELNRIREYICNNPLQWPYDPENPARHNGAVDDLEDIPNRDEDYDG
ncbi:MAG: transposase [Terriglobia bacterium]